MLFLVTVKLVFAPFFNFVVTFLYGHLFFNLTHVICLDPDVSVCHTVLHCEIKCL